MSSFQKSHALNRLDRRNFLQQSAAAASALAIGSKLPAFLTQAARAAGPGRSPDERFVIVIQLSGGNDGLNTVVPHRDPAYRAARPTLRIDSSDVLTINSELGFHPACRGLADLIEQDHLSIINGVGYEQPNRSHFESMDIWHSCHRKENRGPDGWLGRAFDLNRNLEATDPPGLFLGANKLPAALVARDTRVPSIDSPEQFKLQGADAQLLAQTLQAPNQMQSADDDLASFLAQSTTSAVEVSEKIAEALANAKTSAAYPTTPLGSKLNTIARFIESGFHTKVYYVELDGFDTHSQQSEAHRALLAQWSDAVAALTTDLEQMGRLDDALVLSFSEFGRRVAENASEGTDHGAAAPVFLAGGRVAGGVIGEIPSLENLDDGDLRYHTDFRRVYSTVLGQWLGWDPTSILGSDFAPLEVLRS